METTEQVDTVFFPPEKGPRVLSKKTDVIPQDAFFVERKAKGGNKYTLDIEGDRETVLRNCIADFPNRDDLKHFLAEIEGRDLVCISSAEFTHAHAYIFAANEELQKPKYWRADVYELIKPLAHLEDLNRDEEANADQDSNDPLTVTPAMLDELAAYGVEAFSDEMDDRLLPSAEQCTEGVKMTMEGLFSCVRGTRLERYAVDMLWRCTNIFHTLQKKMDREIDQNETKRDQLDRANDGSEISSLEIEYHTQLALTLEETQNVFIVLRDLAAQIYKQETGSPWIPARGSRLSANKLTASVIDSREAAAARRKAKNERLNPKGPVIYVGGSTEFRNHKQVWDTLDERLRRNPSLFMKVGDSGKGAELFAIRWAEANGVDYEPVSPNWTKYKKAAPYMRNKDVAKRREVIGVVAFQNRDNGGSVVINDLMKQAKLRGILLPVMEEAIA